MARPDYAAILARHAGEGETLAGSIGIPVVAARDARGVRGHAHVEPAALYGNRWPALYGGFLFDLAYRAAALTVGGRAVSLELHFLRAVRRADVPERDGLQLEWRVAAGDARGPAETSVLGVELGPAGAPLAWGIAVFDSRDATPRSSPPSRLILPAHDADWQPGTIRGRCLELPGSLPAIADTLLAKAMATVRGDECPADAEEHFLVRTLSYWWIAPVDDALASFEARVVQRGRRMALAVGTLAVGGRVVGRTAGTVAIRQVRREGAPGVGTSLAIRDNRVP
jgi:hypothetical protein